MPKPPRVSYVNARTYEVGNSKITLLFGDITASKAEALVSSDDYLLSMGGGVSKAIRKAAGSRVAAEATKMAPSQAGAVVVTTAGDLPAKYVLHAITIGPNRSSLSMDAIVRRATQRVMELLPLLGCRSVAFPAIGSGAAGVPYQTVASEMAAALVSALLDAPQPYEVELYLMDRFDRMSVEDFFVFFEAFACQKLGLSTSPGPSANALKPPAAIPALDQKQTAEAERRHQVYLMLRHLDARRNQLEAEMLKHLAAPRLRQAVPCRRSRNSWRKSRLSAAATKQNSLPRVSLKNRPSRTRSL